MYQVKDHRPTQLDLESILELRSKDHHDTPLLSIGCNQGQFMRNTKIGGKFTRNSHGQLKRVTPTTILRDSLTDKQIHDTLTTPLFMPSKRWGKWYPVIDNNKPMKEKISSKVILNTVSDFLKAKAKEEHITLPRKETEMEIKLVDGVKYVTIKSPRYKK